METKLDGKDLMIKRLGNKIGQLEINLADSETRVQLLQAEVKRLKAEKEEKKEKKKN